MVGEGQECRDGPDEMLEGGSTMNDEQQRDDILVEEVRRTIHNLLVIKSRLPFLEDFDQEVKRLGGGTYPEARDVVALNLVVDAFSMLVIDLASLREVMVSRAGIFSGIKRQASRFRRFTVEDCQPEKIMYVGEEPSEDEQHVLKTLLQERKVESWNEIVDRLFPAGPPVTAEHVNDLRRRFEKDTEPTKHDRNRVRAHRYEQAYATDGRRFVQDLSGMKQQVQVFEQYLTDIYFVLTPGSVYMMNAMRYGNVKRTAEDFADIIVHGSIHRATLAYGVVTPPASGERPSWYYLKRRDRIEATEDGGVVRPK